MRHSRVLSCPDCTCLFFEDQIPPDYTEEAMLGRGRTAFYLQQGAGISLITRPLAMVPRPPGSAYLEVGCGFGFGLDFALRAKGWRGAGIDPAGLSALGRTLLGLPIELRYLADHEPEFAGSCDVVMASETIEHVTSPAAFLRTLRGTLRPGGILVLTTPNAAEIARSQSPGVLVPLLSPGLHLVLQTAESLHRLLREAGFAHIRQQTDSMSLVAFASDTPFELECDPDVLRDIYRAYLEDRSRRVPRDSDLVLGFAGRCLQEATNDRDWARASRAYDLLREVCRDRFGFDLDRLERLPDGAERAPLERLAELMPLNLGAILFAEGMRRLALELTARAELGPCFAAAAAAAAALRRALGELAMEDGMSEMIGWAARAEGLLCDAAAGKPAAVDGLLALPAAPAGGAEARSAIVERALAWLVNAGHIKLGRRLADASGLQEASWANAQEDPLPPPLLDARRDALLCLGILDAQLDGSGDPIRGSRRLRRLRKSLDAGADPAGCLLLAILRTELQAVRLVGDRVAEAQTIAEAIPHLAELDMATVSARSDDEQLVRMIAERALQEAAHAGDWAVANRAYEALHALCRHRFGCDLETLDHIPDEIAEALDLGGVLYADATRRLVQSLAPRAALGRRFALAADAAEVRHGPTAPLASAARAESLVCDAAAGDPNAVEGLLGLPPGPERDGTLERALAWMVNAGHHALARELAEAAGFQEAAWTQIGGDDLARAGLTSARRDALFCLGVIDASLDGGGDPARGWRRLRGLRLRMQAEGGCDPGFPLAILRTELQAIRLAGDLRAEADTIAEAIAAMPDLAAPDREELAARALDAMAQQLVRHVNAGEMEMAAPVAATVAAAPFATDQLVTLTPLQRDAVFALAVLEVQDEAGAASAERRFARVRAAMHPAPDEPVPDLLWAALRGEIVAVTKQRGATEAEAHRGAVLASLARPEETPVDLLAPLAGEAAAAAEA
ncbi:MAG TPA: class I SAM-dependent methyltransferase [Acetobacteraceae bacterium]|nr:class I SAM-dependent methyltransferase [Acetobacteraceae bacterium]